MDISEQKIVKDKYLNLEPEYIAPEILMEGFRYNRMNELVSDWYSFGVIL